MMRTTLAILSLISATAFALPASATTYYPVPPNSIFKVSPQAGYTIFNAPSIAGTIAVIASTTPGTYTDDFQFQIPEDGVGSGSITTSNNGPGSPAYLNIESVTFNGVAATGFFDNGAPVQFAGLSGQKIVANAVNNLVVTYYTNGSGSYGGNLTFDAAVPEPATWATFLLGFGFMGLALRRKFLAQPKAA